MLVVQQPDGTLAQVPAWMTTAAAGNVVIRHEPRLPLAALRRCIHPFSLLETARR